MPRGAQWHFRQLSGNLWLAPCAATDAASAQTHFVFPTQQEQSAIKKLNSSRRGCNQQRAEDL